MLCPPWAAPASGPAGGAVTATDILPSAPPALLSDTEFMECTPGRPVRASSPRVPGFNGALSMTDCRPFDGAATSVLLDMVRSFFPVWDAAGAASAEPSPEPSAEPSPEPSAEPSPEPSAEPSAPSQWLFYTRPPLGFAVVASPPMGWIVAVEWVGCLFVSPFSQPFFLGSASHKAAVGSLPARRRGGRCPPPRATIS